MAIGLNPEELAKALEKEKVAPAISRPKEEVIPQKGLTPKLPKQRSARYRRLTKLIDRQKSYSLSKALALLKKMANAHFPEKVEAHFNLRQAERARRGLFRRASKSKPKTPR